MKKSKLIILVFALIALLLPINVHATKRQVKEDKKEVEYVSESLEKVLESEGIAYSFEHKDEDGAATVLLFRGAGCSHCHEFLEYVVNTLIPKYGNKVKYEIYEVWNNEGNRDLFAKVANYMGVEAGGVPFIVIGDEYFEGFAQGMDPEITAAIDTEISNNKKEDVVKKAIEYAKVQEDKEKAEKEGPYNRVIIWTFLFVLAATVVTLTFVNKKYNDLSLMMNKSDNRQIEEKVTVKKKNKK